LGDIVAIAGEANPHVHIRVGGILQLLPILAVGAIGTYLLGRGLTTHLLGVGDVL
jgi:hypothetical protein